MIVKGYHGTTRANARSIVSNGILESRRKALWLGIGSYFFQDGYSLALGWASKEILRRQIDDQPAVVEVDIDLSLCIDLVDGRYWERVKDVYTDMAGDLNARGIQQLGFDANFRPLSESEQRQLGRNYLDSEVMTVFRQSLVEDFRENGTELTSVRAAFAEGRPVFADSWMFDESHIMICVFNRAAFVSAFRVAA